LSLATHKVTNLGAPGASTDAATKGYVDANLGGSPFDLAGQATDKVIKWTAAGGGNGSWRTISSAPGGGIQSLGGLTATTQTFATGSTGTSPNWNSATSTHTLNIPMASAATVDRRSRFQIRL